MANLRLTSSTVNLWAHSVSRVRGGHGVRKALDMALGIFFFHQRIPKNHAQSSLPSHIHILTHMSPLYVCACAAHTASYKHICFLKCTECTHFKYARNSHIHTSLTCVSFPLTLKISLLPLSLLSYTLVTQTSLPLAHTFSLLPYLFLTNPTLLPVFLPNIHIFSHDYTQTQMHSLKGAS